MFHGVILLELIIPSQIPRRNCRAESKSSFHARCFYVSRWSLSSVPLVLYWNIHSLRGYWRSGLLALFTAAKSARTMTLLAQLKPQNTDKQPEELTVGQRGHSSPQLTTKNKWKKEANSADELMPDSDSWNKQQKYGTNLNISCLTLDTKSRKKWWWSRSWPPRPYKEMSIFFFMGQPSLKLAIMLPLSPLYNGNLVANQNQPGNYVLNDS